MGVRNRLKLVEATLRSPERRARLGAKLAKSARRAVGPTDRARPVFVAGMQRSGTGMLMNVFHLHPGAAVFDESPDTPVYCDFRVRSIAALRSSLERQALPVAVYKVICDSHQVAEFLRAFPDGRVIWMYRRPEENADSQLRKFATPTRAIKLVYRGEPGGGWLAEGASPASVQVLRALHAEEFSEPDWACLNWWIRNRAYFDQDLSADPRVNLLRYEAVVQDPARVLPQVMEWLGLPHNARSLRFVRQGPVREEPQPALHPEVLALCQDLLAALDAQQRFVSTNGTAC